MATENTRLLKKPFDYLSTASITVCPKSKDCSVVVPINYNSNNCTANEQYLGLTLEELYFYIDDPWWRLLRRGVYVSFWILFVAIFASACIISVIENKQRCIMSVKTIISSADEISRTNYTLAANALTSNLSIATFMLGSSAMQ